MIKKLKIILFIIFYLYQTSAYTKAIEKKDFNPKYLSSYLSAIILKNNQNMEDSIKHFNSSKILINKHEEYLKNYIITLTVNNEVQKAIKVIKQNKNKNNSKFFEAKLLLLIESFKKKNFYKNIELLSELEKYRDYDNYHFIIYEVLKSYNELFLTRKLNTNQQNFGKLSLINEAFQYCYLSQAETNLRFQNLINSEEGDYTRYLFFYLNNLVEKKDFESAIEVSKEINTLNSNLLIQQSKKWIDYSNFTKFSDIFSCKNESDILSEFFFLISNFLSVDENFEKSSFYSNISNYLNPKFYFNLTLLAENYYLNENYNLTRKILNKFDNKHEVYEWYKIKRIAQIVKEQKGTEKFLLYIENKFKKINNPNPKILFDMATIYKNNKKFKKAIKYYTEVLSKIEKNSESFADTIYRRGGSYERMGIYDMADKDLLKSLEISPEEPYVLNYLAYSWLERKYKINEAIEMLQRAYKLKKNDPYIIDSVGWGYYLIGDYIRAEKYLVKAVQLMPDDPIVNDHYADILWKLNRKLQAKYFWENVLEMEDLEEEMKKKILDKLIKGLDET